MTRNSSPWDDIRTPKNDYNVRKIAGTTSIPLYWGKDVEGHCLFVVELEGDHSPFFLKNRVSVHGIQVDLRQLDAVRNQGLVLTLEMHVDRDLFTALCETLISAIQDVEDSSAALAIALVHIGRWKAFMAGKKTRLLSEEEVRGLFSELSFLRTLYQNRLSELEALQAWLGPEDSHQDFIFRNTAVEIKSLSGRERNTVRISSEDQLEGVSDNLFLKVYRLSAMSDSDRASSLNDLVKVIENELTDADAIELFSEKTAASGYVEMREYDRPRFIVSGETIFRVMSEFPRLVRSRLPDGVARVGYEIELEKIKPFECAQEDIWE